MPSKIVQICNSSGRSLLMLVCSHRLEMCMFRIDLCHFFYMHSREGRDVSSFARAMEMYIVRFNRNIVLQVDVGLW